MAKIAILTTPQGHLSIANAIKETLDAHEYQTVVLKLNSSLFRFYAPIYQLLPAVNKVPYSLSKNSAILSATQAVNRSSLLKRISHFINETKPDLIIITHWMYSPAVEAIQTENPVPYINIITDPWSVHPLLVSEKAAANLAFDDTCLNTCHTINSDARCVKTGWFVRKAFYAPHKTTVLRKKLRLDNGYKTILITAGSEGTLMILKLVPALMQLKKPVNVIVMCGSNTGLRTSIRSFAKVMRSLKIKSRLIAVGFTEAVADYMALADIIVGKAGPNTIFETVAVQKPFVAITHISGQEDGNLDLIKKYKLGFVEENPLKVVKLLQSLLRRPSQLTKLQEPIQAMAKYNQAASRHLVDIVDTLVTPKK